MSYRVTVAQVEIQLDVSLEFLRHKVLGLQNGHEATQRCVLSRNPCVVSRNSVLGGGQQFGS